MRLSLVIYFTCLRYFFVFTNYTLYSVTAFNSQERSWLYKFHEKRDEVIFLNGVTNEAATAMDVVVHDCCTHKFEEYLHAHNIEYVCVETNFIVPMTHAIKNTLHPNIKNSFLDWEDILVWVDKKIKENSALKKIVIAKTYENRDIFMLTIKNAAHANKMAVFIVAGEEGRDWLSSALILNYINEMLESKIRSNSLLNYYDFYFVPILNPDGFEYSKEENRYWAKNRKEIRPTKFCDNDSIAIGVNIDRNWLVKKNGLHESMCQEVYVGHKSLSEEETQGLAYILNKIALKLLGFINVRGFQTLICLPYSEEGKVSNNYNIVYEIMKHASEVLQHKYNVTYPVGTTSSYFYNFSGNMADWVKKTLNIPIVFTVYMQHDKFLPQPSHIVPLSKHLKLLINVSLSISRDIYGSLYNIAGKNTLALILILPVILCFCFNF